MLCEISRSEKNKDPVILLPVECTTERRIRTDKISKTKCMDTDDGVVGVRGNGVGAAEGGGRAH